MFIFRLVFISVSISAVRSLEADKKFGQGSDEQVNVENFVSKKRHKDERTETKTENSLQLLNSTNTNGSHWLEEDFLQESARFSITPDFYASMFDNSIASIISSADLFSNTSTLVAAPVVLGVSLLAACGAGIAALIAIVLVPLKIANQILAVIALALLIAYIIEELYIHKHFYADEEGYGEHYDEPSSGYDTIYKREGQDDPLSRNNEIEASDSWGSYTTELSNSIAATGQTTKLDEAARKVHTALNKYYHLDQYKAVHNEKFQASEPDQYFASMFSTS
ncbi:hypothetical protein FHG87_016767 [Trinorchestia longiramus]|nr:hypothetical protein FHG87_016767 [Trinorchestia longiramus]